MLLGVAPAPTISWEAKRGREGDHAAAVIELPDVLGGGVLLQPCMLSVAGVLGVSIVHTMVISWT